MLNSPKAGGRERSAVVAAGFPQPASVWCMPQSSPVNALTPLSPRPSTALDLVQTSLEDGHHEGMQKLPSPGAWSREGGPSQ